MFWFWLWTCYVVEEGKRRPLACPATENAIILLIYKVGSRGGVSFHFHWLTKDKLKC